MTRYLSQAIKDDLNEKMVFLGGPRQVGKTTLALEYLDPPDEENPAYLNWDLPDVRPALLKGEIPIDQPLIIFDEIHKYKNWRNLVKGFYDRYKRKKSFLITGSARLDYYRQGGDSLQGRYHYYRLHPFSIGELTAKPSASDLKALLEFGGFPEPLFKANKKHWRRWQRERIKRVFYEDLITLEQVKQIDALSLLARALPDRVGSPLSIRSLKEDLSVAHETVEQWIRILERLYFCFRIGPFQSKGLRAVRKEKKLYMWDWSLCENEPARFENFVASHLLKYCHFIEDTEGHEMSLRYFRDVDKREIDFVVCKDHKPLFAVECKTGEKGLSSRIPYLAQRTTIPLFYQVHLGTRAFERAEFRARVLPFATFSREIGIP